ncbi:MAG TPA: hemolysin III family protein [Saprospiraceae bacterium]|nr:hemolysin III family protein [Saprospiraceae bacterium]HPN72279.1 hemolysin III family protein [Saprospiraceae bacterium]
MLTRKQSRKEEIANALTHSLGILFCVIAMPIILNYTLEKSNWLTFISVFAFGLGMLMVYSFSTFYHYTERERAKEILLIADHISIYFLIAGTYTPLMIKYLEKNTAMIFLSVMWSIVVLASILKIFYIHRFKIFSLILYVTMGWMMIFVIKPLLNSIPTPVFAWIIAGGICYCIGVYFYVKSYKMYYHTVWHLFVLFGTISHFVSIYMSI